MLSHAGTRTSLPRLMHGLTLVELMVAIVVGLIVIGSTVTFAVSTLRSYTENIRSTRLTQDLRTAMTLAVREIRRSGYDPESVTRVSQGVPTTGVVPKAVSATCILYGYHSQGALSQRAIRLNAATGALQAKRAVTTAACDDAGGWHDISDPRVLEITQLTIREHATPFCGSSYVAQDKTDPTNQVLERASGSVRNFSICMRGKLRVGGDVQRTIIDTARVRAEDLVFTQSPLGTPFAACTTPATPPPVPALTVTATGECANGS